MNFGGILALLRKELVTNAKNFMVVYIVVIPLVLSLLVTLVFGDLFSTTPKLGFVDEGNSQFTELITSVDFIDINRYDAAADLTFAVENGMVDIGIIIPANFDDSFANGEQSDIRLYVWGERMQKDQVVIDSALQDLFADMVGFQSAVDVQPILLGEASESMSWEERIMPFMVLMVVVLSGMLVPAMSLVEEKEKKTLKALVVTPVSLEDVFMAKGLFGVIIAMLMAVIILSINQAFSTGTAILLTTLFIGAVAAAAGGLIFGSYVKDTTSLMAIIKVTGIFLYAPGLIKVFPEVPQWIAKIFPTYYAIGPVIEVTQNGGGWSDVTFDLAILTLIAIVLIGVALTVARRVRYQPLV